METVLRKQSNENIHRDILIQRRKEGVEGRRGKKWREGGKRKEGGVSPTRG